MMAPDQIGQFSVEGEIGRGGMGVVFRGRDSRLGRAVAIKALTADVAADPERLARFEREARLLASLHHPNVATVFGLEDHNGSRYLVMEFVDGRTLSDMLGEGPLPVDEALAICAQVAAGVEAAHEAGVIHRDLKPGNVIVSPDGKAKVLDFGLAKETAPARGSSSAVLTQSPTQTFSLTGPATAAGRVLGTPGYLSPEQARGKTLDKRTDIWSFGCVLYECLTGRRAFGGETISDSIAATLEREPDWSALPARTPLGVRALLERCLAKDAGRRLRDVGDARLELQRAIDTRAWTTGSMAAVTGRSAGGRWRGAAVAAMMLLVGAALGAAIWARMGASSRGHNVGTVRLSLLPSGSLEIDPDPVFTAISPDGTQVVFRATEAEGTARLWLRPLASNAAHPIQGTEEGDCPFWSPDGRFIGFFAGGKLKKIAATGGVPQVLCDAPDPRGGSWNEGDMIAFAPTSNGPLLRIAATGGTPSPLTSLDSSKGETGHRFPCFLPGGKHFLFVALPPHDRDYGVFVASLDGGAPVELMKAWGSAVYAAPGYLVFPRGSAVMAQRFDAARLTLVGNPVVLPELENVVSSRSGARAVSVSANGVLVWSPGLNLPKRLVWLDREGRQTGQVPLPDAAYSSAAVAPDGASVGIMRSSVESDDVLRVDLARGVTTRLTADKNANASTIWSPDGLWITFSSERGTTRDIYRVSADGDGREELVVKAPGRFVNPLEWSRDGRNLLFRTLDPATLDDVWAVSASPDAKPLALLQSPAFEGSACFSPDGRWIAYVSDASGRMEVYAQPFPGPGPRVQVSTQGVTQAIRTFLYTAVWWCQPDEILYIADGNNMMSVPVDTTAGGIKVGVARTLFALPQGMFEVTVAPDTKQFLVTLSVSGRVPSAISVVMNWDAGLRKP